MLYNSVNSWFSKDWDLVHLSQTCLIDRYNKSSFMNQLSIDSSFSFMEPRIKFLGTFLHSLCSWVDQNDDFLEVWVDTVVNLAPKLLNWCLNKKGAGVC